MSDAILVADMAEAEAMQATINKAMGYPMRGTHIGDGRHVDMPEEWDGKGDPPPGWCKNYAEIYDAESKQPAIPIAENDAAWLLSKLYLLDQQESAALSEALASRARIDIEADGYKPRDSGAGLEVPSGDLRDEQSGDKG